VAKQQRDGHSGRLLTTVCNHDGERYTHSMNASFQIVALVVLPLVMTSCSDDRERNIIVDRSPFMAEHFSYEPHAMNRIISSARRFAVNNKMDFLLAQDSLPEGDFNATAAGRDLNLKVMHAGAIDHRTATIFAVAQSAPSKADFKKAREFACAVGGSCPKAAWGKSVSREREATF
jgi:hypothetical protein